MESERLIFFVPGIVCAVIPNYIPAIILIFLLILCVIVFSIRKHYLNQIEDLAKRLHANDEEYRQDNQTRRPENAEQQITKFHNEQLTLELENKSRELANSAMSIVFKNELLQKLRHEIFELKDAHGKKLSSDQLRKIDKIINEAISKEGDWNLFERSFNDAHENFFKKLKANHNSLAPNDLKLCAFLRMNMNSKEIASLLNISLRGVEIRRYRLRKKLDVSHDKNLSEFLLEI